MSKNNRYSNKVQEQKKISSTIPIVPVQLQRIRQDVSTRRDAIAEAERAYFPFRYKLQQMYLNTKDNGHIFSCMERRKDLTLLRKFEIKGIGGAVDEKTSLIFCEKKNGALIPKTWFLNFINHALDAMFYGYSLIHLGDIVDGNFPTLSVVKRWNISPDRTAVMSFPYNPHGVNFIQDDNVKDWYVYVPTPNEIGTSLCGYGLFYEVSVYEIFLRNLLGFNGDFVEMFAQPYRHIKTHKTSEAERAELEVVAQKMGSAGYAITDPTDEITFIETALGGTGYKGYDNLEARLQKLISKIILGHADALDSIPGKLGNSDEKSPAQIAMEDKQSKDGIVIESIVQGLFTNLRNLGFNIPEGTTFGYKNDAEVMEMANNLATLGTKIKSSGLQMDAEYFQQQTGLTVTQPAPVVPMGKPAFSKNVMNRLKAFYK